MTELTRAASGSTYVWYATNNPGPGGGSLYNTGSGWQGGLPVEAGSTTRQTTRGYAPCVPLPS